MKVSISWLKEYVPLTMAVTELAEALTMAGLEVEEISDRYGFLDTVKVARVTEVAPHPRADKLRLCQADTGDRRVRVVCGAPNVRPGMVSALALPGTVLPDGTVLEKSVIRGEASEGMLCSEYELGLGADRSGIMDLDANLPLGESLARATGLSDPAFEIGLTPNRPDCLSIIGVAREVAAIQGTPLCYPRADIQDPSQAIAQKTSVQIESPRDCPRYAARLVEGITVKPSPKWLRERLLSVGLRPINNIVDITNFVMMETGQPLHAFDFDNLAQHRIVVRRAAEGERFVTLDEKERRLGHEMLMICDGQKPVAVGGVMGGLNSEIQDDTCRVLIESAYFDPVSIRKTAKTLNINSDASHRFERGVDPEGTLFALNRAALLMAELGEGELVDGLIDEHPLPRQPREIPLSARTCNRILGTDLSQEQMAGYLRSVEFEVDILDSDRLTAKVPSFRVDLFRPEDLMEEVARLWGYNRIPVTYPLIPAEARKPDRILTLRQTLKDRICGLGFTEAVNYSFVHAQARDWLRLPEGDPRRQQLAILNPLTEDQAVMRTSLVPGLLLCLRHNLAQQNRNLKLFESGKVFISQGQDKLPEEREGLGILWSGAREPVSWHGEEIDCDFYDLKGVAEALLEGLRVPRLKFTALPDDRCYYTRPGHTARILADGQAIGQVGEVHPQVLKTLDIRQTAFILEIDLDALLPHIPRIRQFAPIPRYPAVSRDITLIVDKTIETGELLEAIGNLEEPLLEDYYLFAAYAGDPIPADKKSLSFRLVYRSPEKTLEDQAITRLHEQLSHRLIQAFKAELPA